MQLRVKVIMQKRDKHVDATELDEKEKRRTKVRQGDIHSLSSQARAAMASYHEAKSDADARKCLYDFVDLRAEYSLANILFGIGLDADALESLYAAEETANQLVSRVPEAVTTKELTDVFREDAVASRDLQEWLDSVAAKLTLDVSHLPRTGSELSLREAAELIDRVRHVWRKRLACQCNRLLFTTVPSSISLAAGNAGDRRAKLLLSLRSLVGQSPTSTLPHFHGQYAALDAGWLLRDGSIRILTAISAALLELFRLGAVPVDALDIAEEALAGAVARLKGAWGTRALFESYIDLHQSKLRWLRRVVRNRMDGPRLTDGQTTLIGGARASAANAFPAADGRHDPHLSPERLASANISVPLPERRVAAEMLLIVRGAPQRSNARRTSHNWLLGPRARHGGHAC
jgi:hypothetical protein